MTEEFLQPDQQEERQVQSALQVGAENNDEPQLQGEQTLDNQRFFDSSVDATRQVGVTNLLSSDGGQSRVPGGHQAFGQSRAGLISINEGNTNTHTQSTQQNLLHGETVQQRLASLDIQESEERRSGQAEGNEPELVGGVPRLINAQQSPIVQPINKQKPSRLEFKLSHGQNKHRRNESVEQMPAYNIDVIPSSTAWDKLKTISPREPVEQIERINHFLEVDALFWDRDSHGLFDYECKGLQENKMTATGCFQLVRDSNTLKTVVPKLGCPESYQMLLSVVYKSGAYWIYHTKTLYKPDGEIDEKYNHFEQAWQIIRLQNQRAKKLTTGEDIQNRTHKLKDTKEAVKVALGDVMKFGRVRFRIKKLVVNKVSKVAQPKEQLLTIPKLDSQRLSDMSMAQDTQVYSRRSSEGGMDYIVRMHSSANFSFDMQKHNLSLEPEDEEGVENQKGDASEKMSSTENLICRICLSEEELPDHELITPCKCSGSLRYIGLSCLKEWLEGKRHCKETAYVNSYIWKHLECEICKSPFKDIFVRPDGRELSLLNYKIHEGVQNYMIIESVTQTTSKTIHVVNFDARQSVKVGRAQVAEVRITDISVSRHHSNLTLNEDGSVSLTDNYSKFGTLKLLKEPLMIPCNKTGIDESIYIQVGRTTLSLMAFQRYNWWQRLSCCSKKKRNKVQVENYLHYEESPDQFPLEFGLLFGGAFSKAARVEKKLVVPLLQHYRTRSGNHDLNNQGYTGQLTQDDHQLNEEGELIIPVTQQHLQTDQIGVGQADLNDRAAELSAEGNNNRERGQQEELKVPYDARAATGDLLMTRLMQQQNPVQASITDFTLRLNPSSDNIQTQANEENASVLDNRARAMMLGGSVRQSVDFNNLLTEEQDNIIIEQEDEAVEDMADEDQPNLQERSPAVTQIQPLSVMMSSNSQVHHEISMTPTTQLVNRGRTQLGTAQQTENNVSRFEESKETSPLTAQNRLNSQVLSRSYIGLRDTGPTNREPTVGDASSIMIRNNNEEDSFEEPSQDGQGAVLGASPLIINSADLSRQLIAENLAPMVGQPTEMYHHQPYRNPPMQSKTVSYVSTVRERKEESSEMVGYRPAFAVEPMSLPALKETPRSDKQAMTIRDAIKDASSNLIDETPRVLLNKKDQDIDGSGLARNYQSEEFRNEHVRTSHQPATGRVSANITSSVLVKVPADHLQSAKKVQQSAFMHSAEISVHEQSVLDQPELMSLVQGGNEIVIGEQVVEEKSQNGEASASVIEGYEKLAGESSYREKNATVSIGRYSLPPEGDSCRKETSYKANHNEESKH